MTTPVLTPVDRILPPMIDRLNAVGVKDSQISVIMALGTHRYMTEDELKDKVGSAIYDRVKVFNHEWMEEANLINLGESKNGTPLWVNKAVKEAEVVIGLGLLCLITSLVFLAPPRSFSLAFVDPKPQPRLICFPAPKVAIPFWESKKIRYARI